MKKIFLKDLLLIGDRMYLPYTIQPGMHSPIVKKFINCLIINGKKEKAFLIFQKTFQLLNYYCLSEYPDSDITPWHIFRRAVYNSMPLVGLKKIAKGRASNSIPFPLPRYAQIRLSIRWLLEAALQHRTRGRLAAKKSHTKMKHKIVSSQTVLAKQPVFVRLALELVKASNREGYAVNKKFLMHQTAFKNRAFIRYKY